MFGPIRSCTSHPIYPDETLAYLKTTPNPSCGGPISCFKEFTLSTDRKVQLIWNSKEGCRGYVLDKGEKAVFVSRESLPNELLQVKHGEEFFGLMKNGYVVLKQGENKCFKLVLLQRGLGGGKNKIQENEDAPLMRGNKWKGKGIANSASDRRLIESESVRHVRGVQFAGLDLEAALSDDDRMSILGKFDELHQKYSKDGLTRDNLNSVLDDYNKLLQKLRKNCKVDSKLVIEADRIIKTFIAYMSNGKAPEEILKIINGKYRTSKKFVHAKHVSFHQKLLWIEGVLLTIFSVASLILTIDKNTDEYKTGIGHLVLQGIETIVAVTLAVPAIQTHLLKSISSNEENSLSGADLASYIEKKIELAKDQRCYGPDNFLRAQGCTSFIGFLIMSVTYVFWVYLENYHHRHHIDSHDSRIYNFVEELDEGVSLGVPLFQVLTAFLFPLWLKCCCGMSSSVGEESSENEEETHNENTENKTLGGPPPPPRYSSSTSDDEAEEFPIPSRGKSGGTGVRTHPSKKPDTAVGVGNPPITHLTGGDDDVMEKPGPSLKTPTNSSVPLPPRLSYPTSDDDEKPSLPIPDKMKGKQQSIN